MSCANTASVVSSPPESDRPAILIVGLGNPILGDDGIGWRVAEAVERALAKETQAQPGVQVACYALGGLSLMEHLIGYDQAIIVDAVQTKEGGPGSVYDMSLSDMPDLSTGHLTAAHDTSLQNALKVGRDMGASLPAEIYVVGIEAERVFDFSEDLSPAVEEAIPEAVAVVMNRLAEISEQ